jgi:hypothetical protein
MKLMETCIVLFYFQQGGARVDDLKTTKEIAEIWNVSTSYVCQKAKKAKKLGYPWPIKSGTWEAPLVEWEKIYEMTTKRSRKKRKSQVKKSVNQKTADPVQKYSATKAAALLNKEIKDPRKKITPRWLSILGNRNLELGRDWPQISGIAKVAPLDEWRRILNDESLRAWTRK